MDFVKVEGGVSGHRAVESRLGEGRPFVAVFVRAALVALANAGHAGVDGLRGKKNKFRNVTVKHVV